MVLIRSDTTASVWKTTASLGTSRPVGITSSPDGQTLYVACAGTGSDGTILEIDIITKAITQTIASGLQYPKMSITTDPSGNLYYSYGASFDSGSNTPLPLVKWDGVSASTILTETAFRGKVIFTADKMYYPYRPPTTGFVRRRSLPGLGLDYTVNPLGENFTTFRGMAITSQYVVISNPGLGSQPVRLNLDGTGGTPLSSPFGTRVNGIAAWSDTEVYWLTQAGNMVRYDPTTGAKVSFSPLPTEQVLVGATSQGPYSDIHITSLGRCFVARGGWTARAAIGELDQAHGTDVGIYEIITTRRGGWTVGSLGFG